MLLLTLLLLAGPTLTGRVTGPDGRSVPNATIRVIADGRAPSELSADGKGKYRLEITGKFQLEVRGPGYRTLRSSILELPGAGVYQVDLSLMPGDPSQVENVDLVVESPEEDLATRGEPGAIEALPKTDRLFGMRGGINVTGIAEGEGQRWIAASDVFASSSVSTFVTKSSDFSAELAATGELDAGLPAGQDAFHGSAYEFHRNDAFNARNYFDPPEFPIPPFKYNFFGGDANGTIDGRTYYYAQYWGLRIRQSVTRAATVPDPRWLDGDFSDLNVLLVDPETGIPFDNNQIPRERMHPEGLKLAQIFPMPSVAGAIQNYRGVGKIATAADSVGVRLDRRLTSSNEASIEYQFSRDTTSDPFNLLSGITNLPFFGVRDELQNHLLRITDTHVFSPDRIAQFRFSVRGLRQPRSLLASNSVAAPGPAVLITGLSNLGYAANTPQERRNRAFEWATDFSWQNGLGQTKVGGTIRYFPFQGSLDLYSRGQFQFTNGLSGHPFANLLLGYPANALRLEGDTSRNFSSTTSSLFIEHTWQPFRRLNVSTGLRYDYQTAFHEAKGLAANFNSVTGRMDVGGPLYNADKNNFGPRLGLAFIAADGVVVRAAYGVFYDTLAVGDSLFLLGLNPPFVQFVLKNNGDVLPQFTVSTAFDDTTVVTPPSIFAASRHLSNPYVQHWDASIEKEILRDLAVTVSYFGQKGTDLRRQRNLNQPTPGPAVTLDERRPFPAYRNIFQFETSASSIAHAGEVRVARNFRSGFGLSATYRLSKIIDDATLISMLPQDSNNLRAERGLADFDVRHRLGVSGSWNVPGLFGLEATRHWQLQVSGTIQSGMPLSAVLGTDVAGTGSPIVNRPDLVGDPHVDNPTPTRFFNPDAFRIPEAGTFGNSGRNVLTGPGQRNVDVALARSFRLSDSTRLQFRLDAYNAFNHPNFAEPPSLQNLADSPDFGALFIARSPRILQFGLKFFW